MSKRRMKPSFLQQQTQQYWERCRAPQPASVASPGGTTTEPMQQDAVSQMVSAELSVYVTAPGTSQFGIQSGNNSMDNVIIDDIIPNGEIGDLKPTPTKKPNVLKKRYPSFSINGTQCCGQHTLSGFQYSRDPDCEAIVIGIHQTYKTQADTQASLHAANQKAEREHYDNPETRTKHFRHPHVYPPGATKIAGMIVFTWNHEAYDPAAKKLSEFISKNGLGKCAFSGKVANPNSMRQIEAMTWLVDQTGYATFINKHLQDYI